MAFTTKSRIDELRFGQDVASIEELYARTSPCLVRGLFEDLHKKAIVHWNLDALRAGKLGQARMSMRIMRAKEGVQKIMRYRTTRSKNRKQAFQSDPLGFAWPEHEYDAWDVEESTLETLLQPPEGVFASFSSGVDDWLKPVSPNGVKLVRRLGKLLCPFDCPPEVDARTQLWISSRGLGQQLHFDAQTNVFFHLHGHKTVILSPPTDILEYGHVFPDIHPAARQTQLQWLDNNAMAIEGSTQQHDRNRLTGFSIGYQRRPLPRNYSGYSVENEIEVHLQPGDVLLIPESWGHQTMTSIDGPSVSLAFWFFPAVVDPRPALRGTNAETFRSQGTFEVLDNVIRASLQTSFARATERNVNSSIRAAMSWAPLRELGIGVVRELFPEPNLGTVTTSSFFEEWLEQRWTPQLEALLPEQHYKQQPLPSLLCRHGNAQVSAIKNVAKQYKLVAGLYSNSIVQSMLRFEAGNMLDSIANWMGILELRPALSIEHGIVDPALATAFVLRSFGGCRGTAKRRRNKNGNLANLEL